ncbi:hypothetical protein [Macrococcus armenti]|uniref:hypothetical protein n=1 Tax=Macrococcus armenti TaxID=2875764 RepID=UPI001CD38FAC|nr:hypothetical protein [Macrococcus armenti]UBH10613.1 hypothetical protein LAU38_10300 [Macrococcus armenti]
MKIKRTVEMDLIELLTWAKDNGKTGDFYGVDEDYRVFISAHHGWVQTDNGKKIPEFETKFKVEQEVEITEETKLNIVTVSNDHETYAYENTSIYDLLSEENVLFEEYQAKFIYLQNPDGSIGELIWSKERGLVD